MSTSERTARERFVEAMEERGWSYYKLSTEMSKRRPRVRGSSHGSIINLKNGKLKGEPSLEFLHAAADVLYISRRWLVGGEGVMDAAADRLHQETEARELRGDVERWTPFDLIEDVALSPAIVPPGFRRGPVRGLFGEVIRRRLEIESVVRRTVDDSAEVPAKEVLGWAEDLWGFLSQPLGMDVTVGMTPHEFTGHATGLLSALLRSMTESHRRARIEEAYRQRKENPPGEPELTEAEQLIIDHAKELSAEERKGAG